MGNKNTVSHDYMSDNEHFADICNYYIYNGEQVIKPEDLFEKDATEEAVIRKLERILTKSKIRDVLKGVTIKSDGNITYAVIGIENQSEVHYAMPVRNNLYDSLDYASQVAEIAKKNRKQKKVETASEFLSGFTKDDRMNLIDPHDITDFDKFSTELGDVLEFIRRQSNNEALQTFIYNKGPDWRLDIQ